MSGGMVYFSSSLHWRRPLFFGASLLSCFLLARGGYMCRERGWSEQEKEERERGGGREEGRESCGRRGTQYGQRAERETAAIKPAASLQLRWRDRSEKIDRKRRDRVEGGRERKAEGLE